MQPQSRVLPQGDYAVAACIDEGKARRNPQGICCCIACAKHHPGLVERRSFNLAAYRNPLAPLINASRRL
jgi:hypothetical protein